MPAIALTPATGGMTETLKTLVAERMSIVL